MFQYLSELKRANQDAGHYFFTRHDVPQDKCTVLVRGRWLIVERDDPHRFVIYEADDDGRITYRDQFDNEEAAYANVADRDAADD